MARGPFGWALLIVLALLSGPLHAQDLDAAIAGLGDRVCSLENMPAGERHMLASTMEHRVHLFLRCELMGRDEMVRTTCCEHLDPADSRALGVCPTNPTTESTMREYRKSKKC